MATAPKRAKKPAPDPNSPGELAKTAVEALAAGKQGYKISDSQREALLDVCRDQKCPTCGSPRFKNNGIVKTDDGRTFQIRDKFAGDDEVAVGQKVRRFEVVEIPA
jgi:hypothetical protein